MKKFYTTLALAATVAISASAATGVAEKKVYGMNETHKLSLQTEVLEAATPSTTVKKAPVAKAMPTKVEDLYGYYKLQLRYYVSSYPTSFDVTISPAEKENEVYVSGLSEIGTLPVVGVFDSAKGTLTIAGNQPVTKQDFSQGGVNYGKVILYRMDVNEQAGTIFFPDDIDIVFTFNEDGSLALPELSGWFEGVQNAEKGFGFGGTAGLARSSKFQPLSNEGWDDVQNVSFTDGWFSPVVQYFMFGDAQGKPMIANEIPAFDVLLQRNKENPNLYRLFDPWGSAYNQFVSKVEDYEYVYNESYVNGAVEFNIVDPECVIVSPDVYSGADEQITGLGLMYMTNDAGVYVHDTMLEDSTFTTEEAISYWKMAMADDSSYKFSTYDSATGMVVINDAMFITPMSESYGIYTWTDAILNYKEANPGLFTSYPDKIDMTSVIQLPDPAGINNIIMDKTNSTLEYFNLQGVRVQNPSNGIYIRRQGNDVQKVYVR